MAFLKKSRSKGITYVSIAHSVNVNGKRRHKTIKYLGRYDQLVSKLARAEPIVSLSDISLEKSRDYGSIMVLSKICGILNLKEIINRHAKKQKGINSGTLIEILAINRAVEPKSKLQIASWYEKTVLPFVYGIPSKKLYPQVLCEVLDKPTPSAVFNIHKDLNNVMKEKFNLDVSSVIYDITSTYFEGEKCILAEFGFSRDHRGDKRQIIIGIVISLDRGVPIYHFVEEGNTADISVQIETNTKLEMLGVKKACIVHDRGMTSKANIRLSDKIRYSYITALNSGTKQSDYWIKELKGQEPFIAEEHTREVEQKDGTFKKVKYKTHITERVVREHKILKKYVLVYSEELAERKRKARNAKVEEAKQNLNSIVRKVEKGRVRKKITVYNQIKTAIKGLTKYFDVNTKERRNKILKVIWSFKDEIKNKAEETDGYYVLICSNSKKSKLEIYSAFKYKCEIEAVVRELKEAVKLHPIRHWKGMRPEAQVFVCVLGYLLRKVLKIIMNENEIYDSVSCIIDYLDEIKTIDIKIEDKIVRKNTKTPEEVKNLLRIMEINSEI